MGYQKIYFIGHHLIHMNWHWMNKHEWALMTSSYLRPLVIIRSFSKCQKSQPRTADDRIWGTSEKSSSHNLPIVESGGSLIPPYEFNHCLTKLSISLCANFSISLSANFEKRKPRNRIKITKLRRQK